MRTEDGQWITVKILIDPVRALEQSYLRTKTTDYASFRKTQELRTDTIQQHRIRRCRWQYCVLPRQFHSEARPSFRLYPPVDGSDPATEWRGAHPLDETITLLNPANGWIENTNNWPFSAAGAQSPKREDYPAYMWTRGENPRGLHAVEVLEPLRDATLERLIAAGYDPHLTAFDELLPGLLDAYDRLAAEDPRRRALEEPIAALRAWDRRTGADSQATTLAVFWGEKLIDAVRAQTRAANQYDFMRAHLTDDRRLDSLGEAIADLQRAFGRWRLAWGEVNRFQRLSDDIAPRFDDTQPSLPVGLAPAGGVRSLRSIPPGLEPPGGSTDRRATASWLPWSSDPLCVRRP